MNDKSLTGSENALLANYKDSSFLKFSSYNFNVLGKGQ